MDDAPPPTETPPWLHFGCASVIGLIVGFAVEVRLWDQATDGWWVLGRLVGYAMICGIVGAVFGDGFWRFVTTRTNWTLPWWPYDPAPRAGRRTDRRDRRIWPREENDMGAWGPDTFENDDAVDWTYELEESGLPHVESTLAKAAVPDSEYLEAPDACEVLAACDVVARLRGRVGQSDAYTEDLDAWVSSQADEPEDALIAAAVAAVDRVLGANSELAEMWGQSGDDQGWRSCVQSLRSRLTD